jgi:hypothetical protein
MAPIILSQIHINTYNNDIKGGFPKSPNQMSEATKLPLVTLEENSLPQNVLPLSRRNSNPAQFISNVRQSTAQENILNTLTHKSLSRCHSEPVQQQPDQKSNNNRYKTELCRPFEENGDCKYGDKCQFAHGKHELRGLDRHPKYKTELCRTYHTISFCPYGVRCHFVHNAEEMARQQAQINKEQAYKEQQQYMTPPPPLVRDQRPKALTVGFSLNSVGSESPSPPSSLSDSPTSGGSFFGEDLLSPYSPNPNSHTQLFLPSHQPATTFHFNEDEEQQQMHTPVARYQSYEPPRTPVTPFQHFDEMEPPVNRFHFNEPQQHHHHQQQPAPPSFHYDEPRTPYYEDHAPNHNVNLHMIPPPSPVDSIASDLESLSLSSVSQLSSSPPSFISPVEDPMSPTALSNAARALRLPVFSCLANAGK